MPSNELFQRFPPQGAFLPGPVPRYPSTGVGGRPIQVHLVNRQIPVFQELWGNLQAAQAQPPSDLFEVMEFPDEVIVITEPLPEDSTLGDWLHSSVQGGTGSVEAEESYTQFFQLPMEPAAPGAPSPTSDYSEFFQLPEADPPQVQPASPEPPPPSASPPVQPAPPPPPPPVVSAPVPPIPSPKPIPEPDPEPDPDSITAEFRKPMPRAPQQAPATPAGPLSPGRKATNPSSLEMGDYLSRLDSSRDQGGTTPRPSPPPSSAPAVPEWAKATNPPEGVGSSIPTVVARAPVSPEPTPGRRFRTRDIVIFASVVGLVVVAAVVAVLLVLLASN